MTTSGSPPAVQRLGVQDALDYFADKANFIPGFRMLTIVLGFNPINMRRVDRSAANILRALVELIPGGALITQALDNYGVIDKAAAWVEQQIATLGDRRADPSTRSTLHRLAELARHLRPRRRLGPRQADLHRADRPPDLVRRRRRRRIVDLVKDAILRPLAALAEGTRGYDLLKAVLGQDPITGDPCRAPRRR